MNPLLVFLYHRVGRGKYATDHETLEKHFRLFKERAQIVLPGDPLGKGLSLCLTFDDATFDFYHYVFPLLQKWQLRALLGVPVRYIVEKSDLSPEVRLSVPYPLMMQDGIFEEKVPFCTWSELEIMIKSGCVEVASHSFSHSNLTFALANLEREVVYSKERLEARLPQALSSFVFPFGKSTPSVQKFVKEHYCYTFRIGSGMNFGWDYESPLSRIPADGIGEPEKLFSFFKRLSFFGKGLFTKH